jgi:PKD repeat protein
MAWTSRAIDFFSGIAGCNEDQMEILKTHRWIFFVLFWVLAADAAAEKIQGVNDLPMGVGPPDEPHLSFGAKVAGQNQTSYFSCAGSHDPRPGSAPILCKWDFGDGSKKATGVYVDHVYTGSGTVAVVLEGCFTTPPYTCKKVSSAIHIPAEKGKIEADTRGPYYGKVGQQVRFKAEPVGTLRSTFKWKFGDGHSDEGREVYHTYYQPGIYEVKLTVRTGFLSGFLKAEAYTTAEISQPPPEPPENKPPVAMLANLANASVGQTVTFDARRSYDPEGVSPLVYKWRFGDSTKEYVGKALMTHVYKRPGNYTVVLSVSDGVKESAPISRQITVSDFSWLIPIRGYFLQ